MLRTAVGPSPAAFYFVMSLTVICGARSVWRRARIDVNEV
jgi:hypothetical protein